MTIRTNLTLIQYNQTTTTTKKVYTTKKTTTKKPYTTKKTTKKPYTTKYTTKYQNGKKPDPYKPVMNCPWDKHDSKQDGDCPGFPGKCNLKYFKVCGENFFNKVYDDVCKWQDAQQLIPMVTKKLVPLGKQFEKFNKITVQL